VRRDVDTIVGLLGPILATPADEVAPVAFGKFMALIGFHPYRAVWVRWG
jgi:hypothetical protein